MFLKLKSLKLAIIPNIFLILLGQYTRAKCEQHSYRAVTGFHSHLTSVQLFVQLKLKGIQ